MKKSIISVFLALFVLFSLPVCAFATTMYQAPDPIEVGQSLNHLMATAPADSEVSTDAGTLPPGVSFEIEQRDGQQDIYLRGTPTAAGEYNCRVGVSGSGDLVCTVKVTPVRPRIVTGGGVSCSINDRASVSVSATVSDGGTLSYQWYQSSTNSAAGAVAVSGGTGDILTVDTSSVGTLYYYCVVTNTSGDQTASAQSEIIPVTVEELTLDSISVKTPPAKTRYTVGDKLDTAGLSIELRYHNGGTAVLTEGFTVYPTRLAEAGQQIVEVEYRGKTCSFTVTVEQPVETIDGIGVLTLPTKTSYAVGEELDFSGLSIRVYTNNGHRDVYTGLECSPQSFDKAGSHAVTVSYGGKTCTFNVIVKAEVKPVSLAVGKLPTKTQYTVGDELDITGLLLKETDNTNTVKDITEGFDYSPKKLNKAGQQEILVTYGELHCSFKVTVKEKDDPVQSASPSDKPQPSQIPEEDPALTAKDDGSTAKTVMVVILIIAIIALAGSLVYMIVVKRRDDLAEKNSPEAGDNAEDEELNFFDNFKKK